MRRALPLLALAGLFAAGTEVEARRDGHHHAGPLFELRFEPELNNAAVYRAFLDDPARPDHLIVERANGWLGDESLLDLSPAACPAAAAVVRRLASLPLPAPALAPPPQPERPYSGRTPASYHFSGFVRFPNGGEGEVTFYAYDVPGQRADPLLAWARDLVRAVDACRARS